jgi:hypothetical protein
VGEEEEEEERVVGVAVGEREWTRKRLGERGGSVRKRLAACVRR